MKSSRKTAGAAVLAALVVFVLLFPFMGADTEPPECQSVFGYVVPCGLGAEQSEGVGFAVAGGLLAAGLVVVGSVLGRREQPASRRNSAP